MKKLVLVSFTMMIVFLMYACQNNNDSNKVIYENTPINSQNGYNTSSLIESSSIESSNTDPIPDIISATENVSNSYIDEEEAKNIAMDDAHTKLSEINLLNCKLNMDSYIAYDISFVYNSSQYNYKIDAKNGAILSKNQEPLEISQIDSQNYSETVPNQENQSNKNNFISIEYAKSIVNEKVTGSSPNDVTIQLNTNNDPAVYEGNMDFDRFKYEFKINAVSGEIIFWNCQTNYN